MMWTLMSKKTCLGTISGLMFMMVLSQSAAAQSGGWTDDGSVVRLTTNTVESVLGRAIQLHPYMSVGVSLCPSRSRV
jgi:hypothetical protein